jgi:hypothetical protein
MVVVEETEQVGVVTIEEMKTKMMIMARKAEAKMMTMAMEEEEREHEEMVVTSVFDGIIGFITRRCSYTTDLGIHGLPLFVSPLVEALRNVSSEHGDFLPDLEELTIDDCNVTETQLEQHVI